MLRLFPSLKSFRQCIWKLQTLRNYAVEFYKAKFAKTFDIKRRAKWKRARYEDYISRDWWLLKVHMLLVAIFCLMTIPSVYKTLIMTFIGNFPPWRCSEMENVIHQVRNYRSISFFKAFSIATEVWMYFFNNNSGQNN